MKKKIAAALLGAMMLCGNAFAMQFEQPEELGSVGGSPSGGFIIRGASSNHGSLHTPSKFKKDTLYAKGIALFGKRSEALYLYYDCARRGLRHANEAAMFGDENKTYLIAIRADEGEHCSISNVPNDSGITMYLLENSGPVAGTTNYILLGKRDDGIFVKYIDMEPILENYFGRGFGRRGPWFDKCYTEGDTIIIEYQLSVAKQGYHKAGEFRFKWDEAAQWFGVEQVVY